MCVYVCVHVCMHACVCEIDCNYLNKFDIGHRQISQRQCKSSKVSPFTAIQTVKFYSSTLVQARKLTLSMYVHMKLI